jgi:transcriptional regulator with XRE-family HTH domain
VLVADKIQSMDFSEKIAKNMEKRRKLLGLSLEKLSKNADLSVSVINKLKSGDSKNIRAETLYKLSLALKCAMDELVE